jgi:hypothetical protein
LNYAYVQLTTDANLSDPIRELLKATLEVIFTAVAGAPLPLGSERDYDTCETITTLKELAAIGLADTTLQLRFPYTREAVEQGKLVISLLQLQAVPDKEKVASSMWFARYGERTPEPHQVP